MLDMLSDVDLFPFFHGFLVLVNQSFLYLLVFIELILYLLQSGILYLSQLLDFQLVLIVDSLDFSLNLLQSIVLMSVIFFNCLSSRHVDAELVPKLLNKILNDELFVAWKTFFRIDG